MPLSVDVTRTYSVRLSGLIRSPSLVRNSVGFVDAREEFAASGFRVDGDPWTTLVCRLG